MLRPDDDVLAVMQAWRRLTADKPPWGRAPTDQAQLLTQRLHHVCEALTAEPLVRDLEGFGSRIHDIRTLKYFLGQWEKQADHQRTSRQQRADAEKGMTALLLAIRAPDPPRTQCDCIGGARYYYRKPTEWPFIVGCPDCVRGQRILRRAMENGETFPTDEKWWGWVREGGEKPDEEISLV